MGRFTPKTIIQYKSCAINDPKPMWEATVTMPVDFAQYLDDWFKHREVSLRTEIGDLQKELVAERKLREEAEAMAEQLHTTVINLGICVTRMQRPSLWNWLKKLFRTGSGAG